MAELFHALGIDWKLLLAQVVNFAILAFLLKRFVYGPVVASLNTRRERIKLSEEKVQEIDRKFAEAEALGKKALEDARANASRIVKDAEVAASKLKDTLLHDAHKDVEKLLADGKRKLEEEEKRVAQSLKKDIASLIALSIEKTLGDVADPEMTKRLSEQAIAKATALSK